MKSLSLYELISSSEKHGDWMWFVAAFDLMTTKHQQFLIARCAEMHKKEGAYGYIVRTCEDKTLRQQLHLPKNTVLDERTVRRALIEMQRIVYLR